MSDLPATTTLDRVIDRLFDQANRLALLAAITLAWVATLAWPPPPADFQPRLASGQTASARYPLQFLLPEAIPLATNKLADLIESHEQGPNLPAPAQENLPQLARQIDTSRPAPGAGNGTELLDFDLAPGEVLPINYDLTSLEPVPEKIDRSSGSLTVEKQLYVDGVSSGAATIRIEEGAQILIATKSVAQALGNRTETLPRRISGALAKGTGFIPFYELRGAGIDVSYDPVNDRVSLSTVS